MVTPCLAGWYLAGQNHWFYFSLAAYIASHRAVKANWCGGNFYYICLCLPAKVWCLQQWNIVVYSCWKTKSNSNGSSLHCVRGLWNISKQQLVGSYLIWHWDFCLISYGSWEGYFLPIQGISLRLNFYNNILKLAYDVVAFSCISLALY